MVANSSTKAAYVAGITAGNSNYLQLLSFKVPSAAVLVQGLSLVGTAQGHLYNGLKIDTTTNAGYLTVFREDGTTSAYSKAIIVSPSAELMTSVG